MLGSEPGANRQRPGAHGPGSFCVQEVTMVGILWRILAHWACPPHAVQAEPLRHPSGHHAWHTQPWRNA